MAGVGEPGAAGEAYPATTLAHHVDLAHVTPDRWRQAQVVDDLEAPRPDDVTACLVARELCLVDQRHLGPTPRQHQSSNAARRAATHNDDVKA